jgi:hypothetical protein
MTPTVPELLLGNFLCLTNPPPPESMGEFLQGRVAITGMIALLSAQEAEHGIEARVWENGAIRDLLRQGAPRHGVSFLEAAQAPEADLTLAALDRVNADLRRALIDLHIRAENSGDLGLDHAILRFYRQSADRRRLDLPASPAS